MSLTFNIGYNLTTILILQPLNILVYISFWGMVTRLKKVFRVLQKPKVCNVLYTALFMIIALLVMSEAVLIIEIVYLSKNWSVMTNPFLKYFYYPAARSLNIMIDCMQALIVLVVIKHLHDLRSSEDDNNVLIVDADPFHTNENDKDRPNTFA